MLLFPTNMQSRGSQVEWFPLHSSGNTHEYTASSPNHFGISKLGIFSGQPSSQHHFFLKKNSTGALGNNSVLKCLPPRLGEMQAEAGSCDLPHHTMNEQNSEVRRNTERIQQARLGNGRKLLTHYCPVVSLVAQLFEVLDGYRYMGWAQIWGINPRSIALIWTQGHGAAESCF